MKVLYAVAVLLALLAAGCEENHEKNLEEKNFQLLKENTRLKRDLEKQLDENQQLQKQQKTLSTLDTQTRLNGLYSVKTIAITKYTNFYDKDKDGSKEKLIVYVQPFDSEGDLIKACGELDIELWDLSKESDAMLKKWHFDAEELKKLWTAAVMKANYRMKLDIADIVKDFNKEYTVKAAFTDYVSGKVFTEQHVIKP